MSRTDNRIPTARQLKEDLAKEREKVHASLKDIETVRNDRFRNDGDYSLTFQTKLYNDYGGEYCVLLEILEQYWKEYSRDRG